MMKNKNLGVLLAISSLPGNHGIGDFGESCRLFIDWLAKNHYHYWQVLPLNPIGPGNSPYMSTCSYAIDERYISLDYLVEQELLEDVPLYRHKCEKVNYEQVKLFKRKYLKKAFLKFLEGNTEGLRKFKNRQPWVYKYATFVVFKKINNNKCWNEWKNDHITYFDHHSNPPKTLLDKINFEIFIQYIAYKQWRHVLSYANRKKVKIICDMPFYVGFDGMECWSNKEQFLIDEKFHQTFVGGVGPDAFSETGQLWGSPIYNFKKMKEDGYSLLINRINYLANSCNILRLDHFRAFDTYYVIPGDQTDARLGEWKIGPQTEFLDLLFKSNPKIELVAEDLGLLRPEVYELRDHYHLPGMFVFQFTVFDEKAKSNQNLVVYSGTHDNQTLLSWYRSLTKEQIKMLMKKVGVRNKRYLYDSLINYIVSLPSKFTIIPLQDLLKLDDEARMNEPSTCNDKNWTWKLRDFSFINRIKYPLKKVRKK